ncbi:hypothetical protein [Dictyobacter alpinus]|uniref:hypothetical protein n=1 Tax=Dictyobacter alpinus TaxID=2014873 RepID=UPI000F8490AF|nr:hypothetical protein [Dictyobacter alpinus]
MKRTNHTSSSATRKAQSISRRDVLPGQDHVEATEPCGEATATRKGIALHLPFFLFRSLKYTVMFLLFLYDKVTWK